MFLTGEFSQIARVSKRLLQYYDAIGLLTPAFIDPHTGYRYYSARQLPRLNRILALKELGFTLEHIAQMLKAEVSDEEIEGLLLSKKAELEQRVLDDLQRVRRIEARLQQNHLAEEALEVVVTSIPAQRFLSIRTLFPSPEDLLQLVGQVQRVLPSKVDQGTLGPFVGIVYTDGFSLETMMSRWVICSKNQWQFPWPFRRGLCYGCVNCLRSRSWPPRYRLGVQT